MLYREVGTTGIQVSALGVSTRIIATLDELDALTTLKQALGDGVTLFDLAQETETRHAEELLARSLHGHRRESVVIVDTVAGTAGARGRDGCRDPQTGLDERLSTLRTEYLDIAMLTADDPAGAFADTMSAWLELKAVGKVRALGLRNVTMPQLQACLDIGPIDVVAQPYHMLERRAEYALLPFCRDREIAVFACNVLGQGLLTGTWSAHRQLPPDDPRAGDRRFTTAYIGRTGAMLDQFMTLRQQYALNQAQLTLAWTISRPGITSAIAGVRWAGQIVDLVPGGSHLLASDDLQTMDRIIERMGPESAFPRAA